MLGTLRIGLRNLTRNRRRTLLMMSAIALGQAVVVFVNCMMSGFYDDMQQTITGPMIGHVQIHHPEWRDERAVDLFIDQAEETTAALRATDGVRHVTTRLYTAALAAAGEEQGQPALAEPAMLVGIQPELEADAGGLLDDLPANQRPEDRTVLIGHILANRLQLDKGDELALIGQDADGFPAAELYSIGGVVSTTVDVINRLGVVASLPTVQSFLVLPDQAHEIIVWTDSADDAPALAERLRAAPALQDLEILSWREAVPELVQMIDMKGIFDLIFVGIVLLAATAGIANTSLMSTFERRREFGTLLAVGARPGRIVAMVITEAVILGLAGVLLGSLIGGALVLITSHTGINYAALSDMDVSDISFRGMSFSFVTYPRFEWRQIGYGVAAIVTASVLASLWPAWSAARLHPTEALRR